MTTRILKSAVRFLGHFWLAGPIFTKELRVASRRRRNYTLRFAYLVLLGLFVLGTWGQAVAGGSAAASSYSLSMAGRRIVATIAWFQFVVIQLTAVVLLSTSISEEISHRTIGALLTTPITSLQIVVGKLASKMLLLVELMAVSLPLLAIVRVFGGVPWDYVLATTCITLTAGLVAGCLSLFYSIFIRRAHSAILLALGTMFFLYVLAPALLALLAVHVMGGLGGLGILQGGLWLLAHLDPIAAMAATEFIASGVGGFTTLWWPAHCLIMLGFSILLLVPCVKLVRRAAIRRGLGDAPGRKQAHDWASDSTPGSGPWAVPVKPQPPAMAQSGAMAQSQGPARSGSGTAALPPPWPGAALAAAAEASIARRAEGQIRPVTGSPLLWKEIRAHRRRGGVLQIVGLLAACGILVWSYVALGSFDSLRSPPIHSTYVILFVLCPVVYLAVHAATRISSEKESRSLPILLTTPLSEWDIVWAKARAVARQTLPAWGFLGLHAAIFTVGGVLHPVILLHLALLAVWVTCFLIGSGLYFSSRCKKTTTAVVMNLGLAIALWAVLPVLAGLTGAGMDLGGLLRWINPLAIASRIAQEAAEKWSTGIDYRYTGQELGLVETTFYLLVVSVAYAGMGALFLLGAARRLRKDIF